MPRAAQVSRSSRTSSSWDWSTRTAVLSAGLARGAVLGAEVIGKILAGLGHVRIELKRVPMDSPRGSRSSPRCFKLSIANDAPRTDDVGDSVDSDGRRLGRHRRRWASGRVGLVGPFLGRLAAWWAAVGSNPEPAKTKQPPTRRSGAVWLRGPATVDSSKALSKQRHKKPSQSKRLYRLARSAKAVIRSRFLNDRVEPFHDIGHGAVNGRNQEPTQTTSL